MFQNTTLSHKILNNFSKCNKIRILNLLLNLAIFVRLYVLNNKKEINEK